MFVVLLFLQCVWLQPIHAQKLIPMGHTVEVQIFMAQYFVKEKVQLESGEQLHVHDEIERVNDKALTQKLQRQQMKEPIRLHVKRGTEKLILNCTVAEWQHIQSKISNETDGIGTLTYVTEDLQQFGALGHPINLNNNGEFVDGFIHLAKIQSVIKSEKNTPGYKIIHPKLIAQQVGRLQTNQAVGVFGRWQQHDAAQVKEALPVADRTQITTGEAQMLTQINGDRVEQFTIEITEMEQQQFHFTVSDRKLLNTTGGVIQGMSGSPIIQNGQFIGAVTHMFVENPKKGVAITMEEMLEKSK